MDALVSFVEFSWISQRKSKATILLPLVNPQHGGATAATPAAAGAGPQKGVNYKAGLKKLQQQ
jgi:hypothetical protein